MRVRTGTAAITAATLISGLLLTTGATPASAAATFEPGTVHALGASARSLVLADIDADGDPDQVVSFPSSVNGPGEASVAVLLNDGTGTFAAPVRYPLAAPGWVAAGDLDGDGDDDVVVANRGNRNVWVLRATGTGSLATPRAFRAGDTGMTAVEVADMDGDGVLDVVVGTDQAATLGVLLGTGDGRLGAVATSPAGGPVEGTIGVADVDADGRPDVVVADLDAGVLRFLGGAGDGTFAAPTVATARGHAGGVVLADVDADGLVDVVSPRLDYRRSVAVAHGFGTGKFSATRLVAQGQDEVFPGAVSVSDLDGDGLPELVVTSDSVVVVLDNHGYLNFADPRPIAPADSGYALLAVDTADLDADGDRDVVAVGNVSVAFENTGTVPPLPAPVRFADAVPHQTSIDPLDLAVGDLDGDGHLDVLASGEGKGVVVLGDGTGALAQTSTHDQDRGRAELTDLDTDGDLDAVVLGYDSLQSLVNDGTGRFTTVWRLPDQAIDGGAVADLDGDGRPDVLTYGYPFGVQVASGDGTGAFTPTGVLFPDVPASGLAVADLDADGALDVAVHDSDAFQVLIRYGDGRGGFTRERRVPTSPEFYGEELAAADLDGDGDVDLRTGESSLLNLGDGSFGRARLSGGGSPVVDQVDLDGDGVLDQLTTITRPDLYDFPGVALGLGDGTVQPPLEVNGLLTVYGPSVAADLVAGDLDEDGRLDLVLSSGAVPAVWVLRNTTVDTPTDLVVTQVAADRTQVDIGGTVRITDTVRNAGDQAAAASANRYVLTTSNRSPDGGTALAATRAVPALPGGGFHRSTITATVPAGTTPGPNYLWACSDGAATVVEGDETNNCTLQKVTLLVGPGGPDLQIVGLQRPAASVVAGGELAPRPELGNYGTAAAAPSTTRVYLSSNRVVGDDVSLVGGLPTPVREPGYGWSVYRTFGVSLTTPPGVYYVLVCADADLRVVETSEMNNCRFANTTTTVTAPATP